MEGTVIRFINFSCAVVAEEGLNFSGRFKEADKQLSFLSKFFLIFEKL
jgi:hypothetical protein